MIEIQDKSKCCGCYACFNKCPKNAIEMIEDEKGFKYPKVNKDKCVECGLCEIVCPIKNESVAQNKLRAYACYNINEETRKESSSGGIFSLIATQIINENGVVFGASFNNEFSVQHTYVENIDGLQKLRGSKYVQSLIQTTYKKAKEFLDSDRYVLFTGTPCQIEGLYKYLGKKYDKLYTQDIICHSVPSPKVWKKYIEYKKEQINDELEKVNFRDKETSGWINYHVKMDFKNNNSYSVIHQNDNYMKIFLNNLTARESCYKCSFKKINRLSDITLADFWGIDNILPKMYDNKGTSLVIINSEKGERLFSLIKDNINYEEVDIYEAIKYNPAMLKSSDQNKYRESFFKDLDTMKFDELVKKYVHKPSIFCKIKNKCKRVIKSILYKNKLLK